jgi:carboxypeptidase Q
MKRFFMLNFFIILTFIYIAKGQNDSVVDRIIDIAAQDNQTMDHLDVLCNRFGGRLIGSDAYENAADWAAHKFEEWGMEVIMDEVGEMPVGFNRGPWFGKLLGEEGMHLHFATPSYTVGTKGVQRGHVLLEPKTQKDFERMKGRLKGAWVLISGENKGYPIDFSEEGNARRDSIIIENEKIAEQNREIRRENRKNKESGGAAQEEIALIEEPALFYKQMVDAGILGLIQSSKTPIRAMFDRKNFMNLTFDYLPAVPDIKLDEHQYAKIKQMTEERRYFMLEFDIRNYFKMGPVKYHNVIGLIPGTKFPEEYVIMGAHLDAYDVATGGVDDGSGVSPTMEAARLIMKAGGQPKRSILVILWAGEEFGLLGSQSWIDRNEDILENVSNYVNRDSGPLAPVAVSVSPAMMEDFEKICVPLAAIHPNIPFEVKERKALNKPKRPWGTDSGPFAVAGVPTVGFELKDVFGYNFNYSEIWHTERDTYNMSIAEYQEHAATCTAVLVYGLSMLDHLLDRDGYFKKESKPKKK